MRLVLPVLAALLIGGVRSGLPSKAPLGLSIGQSCDKDLSFVSGGASSSSGANSTGKILAQPTASALDTASSGSARPNIVIFLFDDLGFNDMGRFADEEGGKDQCHAPVMSSLMAEGVKLKQFYVLPICSPTRAALMTGRYPLRYGGNVGTAEGVRTWIPDGEPMFPERLAKVGYQTHLVGKWHLGHSARKWTPTGRGFRTFYGKYRGGGDHWTHQVDLGADTRDGGAWPGDESRRADGGPFGFGPYRPPDASYAVDLVREQWLGERHVSENIHWENGTHSAELFGRESAAVIERHNPDEGPLFLYAAHQAPHWPIQPTASGWLRNEGLTRAGATDRRRHWCGIVTACDDAVGRVVQALARKQMLQDTIIIAFADNGGDVTTGASNHPYRGTKMTPWEGGTRACAFVHSLHPSFVPPSSRGRSSHALAHAVDLFPSLCGLAGCDAGPTASGPMDGIDVWQALVRPGTPSPRKDMVYNIDPLGLAKIAGGFAAGTAPKGIIGGDPTAARMVLRGNIPEEYGAIRVGRFKLVEGIAGRGDWMGSDPASAWGAPYIMGMDAMDYEKVSSGGRTGDMRLGDGGQAAVANGGDFNEMIKKLWLFDIEADPREERDLSLEMPDKVKELQQALRREEANMAEPILAQVYGFTAEEKALSSSDMQKDRLGRKVVGFWADAAERAGDGSLERIRQKVQKQQQSSKL